MQKTFLKFMVFELVERVARFRLILAECASPLRESAPGLLDSLTQEAQKLERQLLEHKTTLNTLFSEANNKPTPSGCEALIQTTYARLSELSRLVWRLQTVSVASETHLFLKDVLPMELLQQAGEHSVFLRGEGQTGSEESLPDLSSVLIDTLSVLQKNNPLAWVSLGKAYSQFLLETASSLESLKLDLLKGQQKQSGGLDATTAEQLIQHALNLRLLGPAYYFQALSEAFLNQDHAFLQVVEPALFFGLNHQNFTHKSLVILHEACERSKPDATNAKLPLPEETLTTLFRVVEKAIPAKYAFNEKNMQRAIQLQERLSQSILLSSTGLFPVEEISETLESTRSKTDFSIYEPLAMLTEYPHSPREIVNAGWLHKMERGPIWLYTVLNEGPPGGFETIMELLDYQDHLLRKSIETSEVHRVLLCSQ